MEAKGILGPFPHALEIWKVEVAIVVKNKRTPNKENIAEQQLPGLVLSPGYRQSRSKVMTTYTCVSSNSLSSSCAPAFPMATSNPTLPRPNPSSSRNKTRSCAPKCQYHSAFAVPTQHWPPPWPPSPFPSGAC